MNKSNITWYGTTVRLSALKQYRLVVCRTFILLVGIFIFFTLALFIYVDLLSLLWLIVFLWLNYFPTVSIRTAFYRKALVRKTEQNRTEQNRTYFY